MRLILRHGPPSSSPDGRFKILAYAPTSVIEAGKYSVARVLEVAGITDYLLGCDLDRRAEWEESLPRC